MDSKLTDFSVMSFDCYGTLIDWETGIWDALQPILMANHRDDIGRVEGLTAFGRHEYAQQVEHPALHYTEILTRVHKDIADEFHLHSSDEMDRAFGYSVPLWPAATPAGIHRTSWAPAPRSPSAPPRTRAQAAREAPATRRTE